MTHDSRVAESDLPAAADVRASPAATLDNLNIAETMPDSVLAVRIRTRVGRRPTDDYNSAAYASLLQVPASEAAHRLRAILRESLFPQTPRGRGRPINREDRCDAALAF